MQADVSPIALLGSDSLDTKEDGSGLLINLDTSKQYFETFSPVNDPLLQNIISVAPSVYTPIVSRGPQWIPTVALGVLMKLFESRPNSSVAFADFDWLPPPDLRTTQRDDVGENNVPFVEPAAGDPLVTDMQGRDHTSYLTSPPNALCDILFPTDFERLASFAKAVIDVTQSKKVQKQFTFSARAMKQRDFLIKYGSDEVNKTKGWTGFSPLIDDFHNCSVLAVSQNRHKS